MKPSPYQYVMGRIARPRLLLNVPLFLAVNVADLLIPIP
jgi:hypothetical protein